MKKNKKAVAMIIVMWILLVTWLLAITMIELIIPFSRSVSGMENSSKAYYLANAWVEDAMLKIKQENNNPWIPSRNPSDKKFDIVAWTNLRTSNNISFSENKIELIWNAEPKLWKWDSEYNTDYNIISVWNPIQMDITRINPDAFNITFKVPKINWLTYKLEDFKIYINWQIISKDWFLNSPNHFRSWRIWLLYRWININSNSSNFLADFNWEDKKNRLKEFSDFYSENCSWWKKCILKFSIANELVWTHPTDSSKKVVLPYLEWRTSYTWWNFKLRYSTVESTWKSNNFVKKLEVKVPQATVNEAFDFTVFQ